MTDFSSDDEDMKRLKAKKMQKFKQNDSDDDDNIHVKTEIPSDNIVELEDNHQRENPKVSVNLEEKEEINLKPEKVNLVPTKEISNVNNAIASPDIDVTDMAKKEEIFNKNSFFSKRGDGDYAMNADSMEKQKIANNITNSDMTNIPGAFMIKSGFSNRNAENNFDEKKQDYGGFTGQGFNSNKNNFDNNNNNPGGNFYNNRGYSNRGNNNGFGSGGNRFGDRDRENNNFRGNNFNNRRGGGRNFGDRERDRDDRGPRGGGFGRPFGGSNFNRGNNPDGMEYKKNSYIEDFPFYKDNKDIIDDILKNFTYLDENSIISILKITILDSGNTIFELMNELSRENIIKKNINANPNRSKTFNEKVPIFEKHERNLPGTLEFMMKSYKTNPHETESNSKLSEKENYLTGKDRRRKILRDVDGYYNYIPLECNLHPPSENIDMTSDQCIYSHNDYDINYHSLMYKTKLCKKSNCEKICPKAHSLGEEFRRIYDYRNKGIIDLTVKLESCQLLKNSLINYMSVFEVPTNFSLDTFKIMECKLPGYCGQDPHLCLNYHNEQERRRPPKLFKLVNEICNYAQPGKDSDFYPHLCQKGDHCEKIHTRYELLYHYENFRKIKTCTRTKDKGRCKFYLTCYGIHPEDTYVNSGNIGEDILKNYVRVDEYNKLMSELKRIKAMIACQYCKVFNENLLYCQTKCQHIMCETCIKKACSETKKCFVCSSAIEKGSIIKLAIGGKLK